MISALGETVREYLVTSPASMFYGQPVRIIDEWRGGENSLLRAEIGGASVVVKVFLDAGQARGRRQYDGMYTFAPLGLAPTPLWFDRYPQGMARQLLVYEWEEGSTPGINDAAALAECIAQVHRGDPNAVRRFCPHPLNLGIFGQILRASANQVHVRLDERGETSMATAFAEVDGAAQELIDRSLPLWQSAPPTPVHGDLTLENSVLSRGRALLLDWEYYGLGDPALEISRFLAKSALKPDSGWLDGYLALVDSPLLAERIEVYGSLLRFEWLCTLLRGGLAGGSGLAAADATELALLTNAVYAQVAAALERAPVETFVTPDIFTRGLKCFGE